MKNIQKIYLENSFIEIPHTVNENLIVTIQFLDNYQEPILLDLTVHFFEVEYFIGTLDIVKELVDINPLKIINREKGIVQVVFSKEIISQHIEVGNLTVLKVKLVDSNQDVLSKVIVNIPILKD